MVDSIRHLQNYIGGQYPGSRASQLFELW